MYLPIRLRTSMYTSVHFLVLCVNSTCSSASHSLSLSVGARGYACEQHACTRIKYLRNTKMCKEFLRFQEVSQIIDTSEGRSPNPKLPYPRNPTKRPKTSNHRRHRHLVLGIGDEKAVGIHWVGCIVLIEHHLGALFFLSPLFLPRYPKSECQSG